MRFSYLYRSIKEMYEIIDHKFNIAYAYVPDHKDAADLVQLLNKADDIRITPIVTYHVEIPVESISIETVR